jgi:hypothetical protein
MPRSPCFCLGEECSRGGPEAYAGSAYYLRPSVSPYPGEKNLGTEPAPVFFLYEAGDEVRGRYSLAVCREPPGAAPEPVWFSPDPLPFRSIALS